MVCKINKWGRQIVLFAAPSSHQRLPRCFCPLTEASFLPTFLQYVFQEVRSTKEAKTEAVSWLEGCVSPTPPSLCGSSSVPTLEAEQRFLRGLGLAVSSQGSPPSSPEKYPHPQKPDLHRGYPLLPRPTHLKYMKFFLAKRANKRKTHKHL